MAAHGVDVHSPSQTWRGAYRDHHATIFLPADMAGHVETARRRWDPVMAARIAAHVTLAYPEEAPLADLLVERVREASRRHASFRLRLLGDRACFERPERGVYVGVEDVEGGYARLRADVLRSPLQPRAFPPHVTVVHPRTSARGRELWLEARSPWLECEFTVTEIAITGFDGTQWAFCERFPLAREGSA